eukprot:439078-Alexandrium_andersonii.AAC.1
MSGARHLSKDARWQGFCDGFWSSRGAAQATDAAHLEPEERVDPRRCRRTSERAIGGGSQKPGK